MALHGEIKVNGGPIYRWEAVRKEPVPGTADTHRYNCIVQGYRQDKVYQRVDFRVQHSYAAGAVALAAAVLQEATYCLDHDESM